MSETHAFPADFDDTDPIAARRAIRTGTITAKGLFTGKRLGYVVLSILGLGQ